MRNAEGEWVREELRENGRKMEEMRMMMKEIDREMEEMKLMMERMTENKEKHNERSKRRERNYEEFSESSHHNHDLCHPPPRQHRIRHHHKEPKLDLPPFFGKDSMDDCLDWEMKVEQLFEYHQV